MHRDLLRIGTALLALGCSSGTPAGPLLVDDGDIHMDEASDSADAGVDAGRDAAMPPTTDLTYWADVRPIIEENCVPCHGPGGERFSLFSYASARSRRFTIRNVVSARIMPPCDDEPAESCGLSQDEIDRIVEWAAGGAPEGTQP